ncbi:MAG: hypothetical protein WCJ60_01015 [bacterium]
MEQKAPVQNENVAKGLLFASLAIPIAVIFVLLLWNMGFMASLTSFALAYLATYLYLIGARHTPLKGAKYLLFIIMIGIVISFFAIVAADLFKLYGALHTKYEIKISRLEFIQNNIFKLEVLKYYAKDAGFFLLFAVLGSYRQIMLLFHGHKAYKTSNKQLEITK